MSSKVARHLLCLMFFAAAAVMLTWPLARTLTVAVPGTGPDDNMMFLWDFWWARHVLHQGGDLFFTSYLFAPIGTSLVLHTHFAAAAVAGATVLRGLSEVAALNVILLISAFLNGWLTFGLTFQRTRNFGAALIAGFFFMSSASLSAHLFGHFNFYGAWVLVATMWAASRCIEAPSIKTTAACAAALAFTAYWDYYYLVYALGITVGLLLTSTTVIDIRSGRFVWRRSDAIIAGVGLLALTAGIAIAMTGGTVIHAFGRNISLTTGRNVRAVAAAAGVWLLCRFLASRFSVRLASLPARRQALSIAAALCVAAVAMLPLLWRGYGLARSGGYVSQHYLWRSAPGGADLAGLVLGNPFGLLLGSLTQRLYAHLSMHAFDGPLWLGVAPIIIWAGRGAWMRQRYFSQMAIIGGTFFIWALGPRLTIAGVDTGLPLPAILLRFVPIVSNVRIPGHAMAVVMLACAVMLGGAVAASSRLRSRGAMWLIVALCLADGIARPVPVYRPESSIVIEHLRSLPPGIVLDLPFGLRDGFGGLGRFDPRTLYYQTIHQHPVAGGYIARLPPSLIESVENLPALEQALVASGNTPPRVSQNAAAPADIGIRYVLVDESRMTEPLRQFLSSLSPRLLMRDDELTLYAVDQLHSPVPASRRLQ